MASSFVHLHNHTEHSKLDGASRVKPLFAEVARLGMSAVAMTDHGNMFGAYEFFQESREHDVKPILGIEAYVAPSSRFSRKPEFWGRRSGKAEDANAEGGKDVAGGGRYTHMTMLARTASGLRNLFRLSSLASYEGTYGPHPRMDRELLSTHSDGIIATTGCPSGEVQTRLRLGQYDPALRAAATYRDIFGADNYYLEVMDHGLSIERSIREDLLRLGRTLNLPLLATNDAHYVTEHDADMHDNLLCVGTGRNKSDTNRFRFDGADYFIKSAEQMRTVWAELPEACDNTLLVAEQIEPYGEVFDNVYRMPTFPVPDGETQESWFRHEVQRGLHERYPDGIPEDRQQQADFEMNVIITKGFPSYFLVVSDFIRWAKENGIRVGPGRGCLTGDTPILTERGTIPLRAVRKGDVVRTHTGAMRAVSATHRYECDEELLHLRTYYDDQVGVTLTGDHKVWAEKVTRETNKTKVAQGIKWRNPTGGMDWVRADELEVGDLLAMPRPQGPWVDLDIIDLAQYADDRCEIDDDSIIETHATNRPFKYSVRDVHRVTGVSRNALKAMLQAQRVSYASTQAKVMAYVGAAFNSLDEWSGYVLERQTSQTRVPRYLRVDEDFCRLMGMLAANGWLRADDRAEVGVATRRSTDDGLAPNLFKSVWALTPSKAAHNQTDLMQYRIQSRVARAFYAEQWAGYEYKAQSKSLPAWVLNLPEMKRRALLEGLWWGDGSHNSKSTYSTTSPMLRDAVRHLLLSLGLPAGVRHEARIDSRPDWPDHASWTITTTPRFKPMVRQHGWSDDTYVYLRLREVSSAPAEPVYDITVDIDHSYTTSSFAVHNSGAGSMCAFAMRITDLDPIPHGLLFERFLNPERPSMPDFDIDFDERRRVEVIRYVTDKYGADHSALVVTFGKMKAKQAMKDAARILEKPYSLGETLAKAYPPDKQGATVPLKDVFSPDSERYSEGDQFRSLYETDADAREVVDAATDMEGSLRNLGVHAAAVILSNEPLLDVIPMHRRTDDGALITGFDYPSCESMGLVKMDFLGLKNLTTVDDTITHVKVTHGVDVDLDALTNNPDDSAVYALLSRGDTMGVFQFDSSGYRDLCRLMQPDKFGDISALGALYRPGPMGAESHTKYALRKTGQEPITPIHPEFANSLNDVLGETYGLIVYQEQVMEIAQKLAGYTLGAADSLRRAMGKKKKSVLDAEFVNFEAGMIANGYSKNAIKTLWDILIPFSAYAFNKAHSAAYGMISYWTAWLKVHYPPEFMAALLTSVEDDKTKLAVVLQECKRMRISVLSPDVNESGHAFTPANGNVRFGLTAIRNVGAGAVTAILNARERGGPFESFEDFVDRIPTSACNRKTLESLIRAGAFDSLGHSRRGLEAVLDHVLASSLSERRAADAGQESLLGDFAPAVVIPTDEWDKSVQLAFEREMLGMYVSDHPLNGIGEAISRYAEHTVLDVFGESMEDRQEVALAGLVTAVERKRTKAGQEWALMTVEDLTGEIAVMVFSKSYRKFGDQLQLDGLCYVTGNVQLREDGGRQIVAASFTLLDPDLVAADCNSVASPV